MTHDRARVEHWTDGLRGLVLGLALGESGGRRQHRADVLRAGVATQLAAFTLEGMIRASVRQSHRGICSPEAVIQRAYVRWGTAQGIPGVGPLDELGEAFSEAPDGWLRAVPALSERRGSSPTTVKVLREKTMGTPDRPVSNSMGCQGLVRVLPLAALGVNGHASAVELARAVTALTHGHPLALDAASLGVTLAIHGIEGADANDALHDGANETNDLVVDSTLHDAMWDVIGRDYERGSLAYLREVAPDKTARSALLGGLYVATTYPHAEMFLQALEFAALAPDGDSVAAVAGALLGAGHGASQLPVELVSRHELAWALDVLARDAVSELTDSPGGSEFVPARDPQWWNRYPGW